MCITDKKARLEARNRSKMAQVRTQMVTIIKPLQKVAHVETIDPTFMDLMNEDMFFPVFFAYRNADKSKVAHVRRLHRIKESLAEVLITFFGFAGRWVATTAGGSSSRQLLCNDAGVPFIEAYVDKELDSVVKGSAEFQPVTQLQGYGALGMDMSQFRQKMRPDGQPCIFVQLTRFKCGGVVVAVTFNHCHTDGQGFYNFMRAWSDISRTNETEVKADHNRAVTEIPSFTNLLNEQNTRLTSTNGVDGHRANRPKTLKAFEVRAAVVKSLKEEAKDDNFGGGGYVSTVDCIVAHVWRSLSRLPSSLLSEKELSVGMDVEGRNRFYDPPLPDLCGNVVAVMSAPKIPLDELQVMPLASIAKKVREKLQTTRREEWLGLERFGETMEAFESSKFAVIPVTSWFNFPLYEIDFGFGKPFFASSMNNLCSTSALAVANILPPLPNSPSSIATVYIWSTPELLQTLEGDPEFLPFFLPRPNST